MFFHKHRAIVCWAWP